MPDTIKRDNKPRPISLQKAKSLGLKPVLTYEQEALLQAVQDMRMFSRREQNAFKRIVPIPPAIDPSQELAPIPRATESAADSLLRRLTPNEATPAHRRERRERMFRRDI